MMDDTISRAAALDALDRLEYTPGEWATNGLAMCKDVIKALPPAQPGWIPCSERLPDNNRQVLVYARSVHFALAKYDEMREADGTYKMQWVTFDAWKPFYNIKEVIAWMPLPKPWEGGQ